MLSQENKQFSQRKPEPKPNIDQFKPPSFTENLTYVWDEQLLKNILGRPVVRSIYDNEGDLILDVGDLITYRAVERAKQANLFDFLLSAVYYK